MGVYISKLGLSSSPVIPVISTTYRFLFIAYIAPIGIFLFHLAIRGMWIGAIGLRSVSGDFDYNEMRYPDRFTAFLRKRLGSYDDYIQRLERNASVTFSLAFLLKTRAPIVFSTPA